MMKKWMEIPIFCVILALVCGALAQEQTRVHIVKKGDTLWDLSGYYLENPFLWPDIYEANTEKIDDPHWIYPGQEFVIPPYFPRVPEVLLPPEELPPEELPPEELPPPEEPAVLPPVSRVEYEVPIVAKELAYEGGYLAKDEEIFGGYILESDPPNVENLTSHMSLFIDRGAEHQVNVGDRFTAFRVGRKIKHPKTGEYLGKIIRILGIVRITEVRERTSRAVIERSSAIMYVRDRIKPYEPEVVPVGEIPEPTDEAVEGYLVARKDRKGVLRPFDIVYIDNGMLGGLQIGDVFEVYREGKWKKDPETGDRVQLPDDIIGALQVLKLKETSATAYMVSIDGKLDVARGETIRLVSRLPTGG